MKEILESYKRASDLAQIPYQNQTIINRSTGCAENLEIIYRFLRKYNFLYIWNSFNEVHSEVTKNITPFNPHNSEVLFKRVSRVHVK